ncbi:M24 family metallopeptidase, partial [Citrobacter sp. AAK_AS5]
SGEFLAGIFDVLGQVVEPEVSTGHLDSWIERELGLRQMVSGSKGYMGFKYSSCISLNDEVVHGIPSATRLVSAGDIVKID